MIVSWQKQSFSVGECDTEVAEAICVPRKEDDIGMKGGPGLGCWCYERELLHVGVVCDGVRVNGPLRSYCKESWRGTDWGLVAL